MLICLKKYKVKLFFLLFLVFFGQSFLLFSATDSNRDKWIIAAEELSIISSENKTTVNASIIAAAKQIPQLILGHVTEGMQRIVVSSEQFERDKYNLLKQRQSLFSEYSSLVQKRDAVIFSKFSKDEVKQKIAEAEEKIKEVKEKILKNIEEENKIKTGPTDSEKEKRNFFVNLFSSDAKEKIEEVAIWQNDKTKLFSFTETFTDEYAYKQELEKSIIDKKINGLMTGTIQAIGEFISVSMELRQYPGGNLYATANEVGLIYDTETIANSLSTQLLPSLINTIPVKIDLLILPEIVAKESVIYIGDDIYRGSHNQIFVQPGICNLRIETPNYKSVNLNYDFSNQKEFFVTVQLREVNTFNLFLFPNIEDEGLTLNLNALPKGNRTNISINGKKVYGEILDKNNWSNFFIIDTQNIQENSQLAVNAPINDITEKINKTRRQLYNSYGLLMLSVPLYFVGKTVIDQNYGGLIEDATGIHKGLYWGGIGVLVTSLTNFAVQLTRFLLATNEVLPQNYTKKNVAPHELIEDIEESNLNDNVDTEIKNNIEKEQNNGI